MTEMTISNSQKIIISFYALNHSSHNIKIILRF